MAADEGLRSAGPPVMAFSREAIEVEALRTDRYLEALLAQRDGTLTPGTGASARDGASSGGLPVDAALRAAVATLDRSLVRVHPSFRFEERLARRLAEVADAMRVSEAAGAEGARVPVVLPFDPGVDPADPELAGAAAGLPAVARPLLIGALSLAGAAIVAWRFGRPGDPMSRAVRAASQLRGTPGPHGARRQGTRVD